MIGKGLRLSLSAILLIHLQIVFGTSDTPCGCMVHPHYDSKPNHNVISSVEKPSDCLSMCREGRATVYSHIPVGDGLCVCGFDKFTCEEDAGHHVQAFCIEEETLFDVDINAVSVGQADTGNYLERDLVDLESDLTSAEQNISRDMDNSVDGSQVRLERESLDSGHHHEHTTTMEHPQDEEGLTVVKKRDYKILAMVLGAVVLICLLVGIISVLIKQRARRSMHMKKKNSQAVLIEEGPK